MIHSLQKKQSYFVHIMSAHNFNNTHGMSKSKKLRERSAALTSATSSYFIVPLPFFSDSFKAFVASSLTKCSSAAVTTMAASFWKMRVSLDK